MRFQTPLVFLETNTRLGETPPTEGEVITRIYRITINDNIRCSAVIREISNTGGVSSQWSLPPVGQWGFAESRKIRVIRVQKK